MTAETLRLVEGWAQRTLDALKRLFLQESQVQPLLRVFENLHWIDAETQASLDGLVESLPAAPRPYAFVCTHVVWSKTLPLFVRQTGGGNALRALHAKR